MEKLFRFFPSLKVKLPLSVISHALVHFIQDWSPVRFQKMADLVMEGFNLQNISAEELIMMKQAEYKEDGIELTEEQAFEEVIAASLEDGGYLSKTAGCFCQRRHGCRCKLPKSEG